MPPGNCLCDAVLPLRATLPAVATVQAVTHAVSLQELGAENLRVDDGAALPVVVVVVELEFRGSVLYYLLNFDLLTRGPGCSKAGHTPVCMQLVAVPHGEIGNAYKMGMVNK